MLNGGPVAWGSKKQTTTASSTTEAEYYAAHRASREIRWMRRLLGDIGFTQLNPTVLHTDNQSAIRLIRNPEFHQRTKHIDIKFHVIREYYENGDIDVQYISTDDNIADLLTKPLPRDRFQRLRSQLSLGAPA